jgi:uncharacterized membrane protein
MVPPPNSCADRPARGFVVDEEKALRIGMDDQQSSEERRSRKGGGKTAAGPSIVADENIRAVARIQDKAARHRTFAQRLSDKVSAIAARESAIVVHFLWFSLWISANVGVFPIRPFDPFPFSLLTTIVSLEAIFLTLFVLSSQNRLTQDTDRRAHLDLQINLLSEQEMTVVLQMLREVCEHLGLHGTINSRKFRELVQRTDVGEVADQVEKVIGTEEAK